jgi:hypothetical protein
VAVCRGEVRRGGFAQHLGDEPRLAHAAVGGHPQYRPLAVTSGLHPLANERQLAFAADHRQRVAQRTPGRAGSRHHRRPSRHGRGLALQDEGREVGPHEVVLGGGSDVRGHVHLPRRRLAHQACGHVDGVAQHRHRAPLGVAVRPAEDAADGHPDLQADRGRGHFEIAYLDGGRDRPAGVVLVRARDADDGVQVRALVADRDAEQRGVVAPEDLLGAADEDVDRGAYVGVVVELEAAEPDEHRVRAAQLGEERSASADEAVVDEREEPWPHPLERQRRRSLGHRRERRVDQVGDHAAPTTGLGVLAHLGAHETVAERVQHRFVGHDLARGGHAFGRRQSIDEGSTEDVEELHIGIADDHPPGLPHHDRNLDRECDLALRRLDPPRRLRGALHVEGAADGPGSVVAVEPAGDGVAAEVDDLTAVREQVADDRLVDAVEVRVELLGPPSRPVRGHERLGQRREPGDVGEQPGAAHAVGDRTPLGDRRASVAGEERLEEPGRRLVHALTLPAGRGSGGAVSAKRRPWCPGPVRGSRGRCRRCNAGA